LLENEIKLRGLDSQCCCYFRWCDNDMTNYELKAVIVVTTSGFFKCVFV